MDYSSTDGPTAGDASRPRFTGTVRGLFPVVFKGLFLTIVTLGIYRFWYQTHVRRFLWINTEVGGDALEYNGRGVELFIGFLIALAVVMPLYGVLFLVGLATGPAGAAAIQSLSTIALLFLAQFALFRARRYRLTRTIWRGVRFQQSGSGLAYAALTFGWGLLAILTFGLAYPFMRASLERYKMINTWYGDQKGAFSATGWGLFRRGIWLWLGASAAVVGSALLSVGFAGDLGQNGAVSAAHVAVLALPALSILIVLLVVLPVYLAIEYRWWANGCRIGPAVARCDLGLFAFWTIYARYLGIVLLFSLAVGSVAGGVGFTVSRAHVFDGPPNEFAQFALLAGAAVVYFTVALTFAALWQLFGARPLWARSFESVAISGLAALTAAQSSEPAASAFGEGVADALDFGGF